MKYRLITKLLWYQFYKFHNFFIGKVFNVRLLLQAMARQIFIAVMANGYAFFGFFLESLYKHLYSLLSEGIFSSGVGLVFKNRYDFNIKAH